MSLVHFFCTENLLKTGGGNSISRVFKIIWPQNPFSRQCIFWKECSKEQTWGNMIIFPSSTTHCVEVVDVLHCVEVVDVLHAFIPVETLTTSGQGLLLKGFLKL